MTLRARRTAERPDLPWDELNDQAKFPKPRRQRKGEVIDTRDLQHSKMHPHREESFLRWLTFRSCSIEGLIDKKTEQRHVCWSPNEKSGRFKSDPCHTWKAGLGIKGDDKDSFSLCRHAHRQQEPNMDDFDERYGINRHEIAERQYAEYQKEKERRA